MARHRIVILGHLDKPGIREQIDALRPWFDRRADVLAVGGANEPLKGGVEGADVCVVFGGDGTLLAATRTLAGAGLPLLGVNMGKLGFLAEFSVEDLRRHFDAILDGKVHPTERMMLKICVSRCRGDDFCSTAVNDIAIQAGEPFRMIELNVEQDGGRISQYLGDGLVIATPTGSTAYNMSLGGPIVEPTLEAITITPIAPHTLSLRPMVVRSDRTIRVTPVRVNPGSAVIIDGQATTGLCDGDSVDVSRADATAKIFPCPGRSFFQTLTDKLHWGRGPNYNAGQS